MTELFIDGVSVVLPKDFSIAVKRENPMFTKNGEYTYDITLQLTNPTNAKLYEHLNRLNSVTEVKSERTAILRADNRVYCNGTEIITGWTDDTVSIQIASGNSELNYFIGADKKIEELEMANYYESLSPLSQIELTYPSVDYNLVPVYNQDTEQMCNAWFFNGKSTTPEWSDISVESHPESPQPYLCAYIKWVLQALGYQLTKNQLEDTVFKDLYICHANVISNWNQVLRGWTVLDFLTQIEQLFDMVFVVDNKTKTAALLFRGRYLAGADTAHVKWVSDVYESETEDEPDFEDMTQANVSYNLPGDDSWKFARLEEAVKQAAKYETIPDSFTPQSRGRDRVLAWFEEDEAHQNTQTIYTDAQTGRQYLFQEKETTESGRTDIIHFTMVDHFADLAPEGAVTDVELDITPVTLADGTVRMFRGVDDHPTYTCQLPSVSGGMDYLGEQFEAANINLVTMIEEGTSSESSSELLLAFYSGMSSLGTIREQSGTTYNYDYPIPYIDEYVRVPYRDGAGDSPVYRKSNSVGASLRLHTLDEIIYQTNYDIDYNHGIKLSSYDPNVYDPMAVFEIRHKRYVCKEIEYTLDAHGRKGAWTGTFYPIRLSDTEADLRWILADGKWRDGGVWLDNGRWLDS